MIRRPVFVLISIGVLAGCAGSQGLDQGLLQATLNEQVSRFAGTSSSIGHPVPPKAPVLGLYLQRTQFLHREFEWTDHDRETVLAWARGLQLGSEGRTAGFVPLSSLKGNTLKELRASAARYGVDWVLIVDGAAAVDRYNNYKAPLLYWTILGAYLVDGTHSDALCVLLATVWDVKTGARLFDERADSMTKAVGPVAFIDDMEEIERAKRLALDTLLKRLTDRFAMFTGTRQ